MVATPPLERTCCRLADSPSSRLRFTIEAATRADDPGLFHFVCEIRLVLSSHTGRVLTIPVSVLFRDVCRRPVSVSLE